MKAQVTKDDDEKNQKNDKNYSDITEYSKKSITIFQLIETNSKFPLENG